MEVMSMERPLYLIESKSYFIGFDRLEYQTADGGDLPTICTSLSRAEELARWSVNNFCELFGYTILKEDGNRRAVSLNKFHRWTLVRNGGEYRRTITIYLHYITK